MLERITIETFADHIGELFSVSMEAGEIGVELTEATALTQMSSRAIQTPGQRAPFSLEFLGPPEPLLSQGIYPFEHEALGVFEISLCRSPRRDRDPLRSRFHVRPRPQARPEVAVIAACAEGPSSIVDLTVSVVDYGSARPRSAVPSGSGTES